jgi:transcriptional regulator with XRE-family HTH domain
MDRAAGGPSPGSTRPRAQAAGTAALGARIREERQRRGMSLRELARRAGLSPSLVSQIETGKSEPSVSSLAAISTEIGISLNELVFEEDWTVPSDDAPRRPSRKGSGRAPGVTQEEGNRRTIHLDSNVTWQRLTAEPDHDVDFLHVTYDVGGASAPLGTLMRHPGKEYGFVISGRLGVTVGFEDYELGPGGSISFDSTVPHRLWNAGDEPVRAVWTVVGRRSAADAHAVELD